MRTRSKVDLKTSGVHSRVGSSKGRDYRDNWNSAGGSGKVRSEAHVVIHVQCERALGL